MGRTKAAERLFDSIGTPPDRLEPNQLIACIVKARGNSLYEVRIAASQFKQLEKILHNKVESEQDAIVVVSMPPRFRNTIFVKRGGYILIELFGGKDAKVKGEICNIVVNKKGWQRFPYWPEKEKESEKGWEIDISDDEDEEDENDDLENDDH